jgi:WD40 repeat protein
VKLSSENGEALFKICATKCSWSNCRSTFQYNLPNRFCSPIQYLIRFVGDFCFVGANEEVLIFQIKEGNIIHKITDENYNAFVTALQFDNKNQYLAVGYSNGFVNVYDMTRILLPSLLYKFSLHYSPISTLCFYSEVRRIFHV